MRCVILLAVLTPAPEDPVINVHRVLAVTTLGSEAPSICIYVHMHAHNVMMCVGDADDIASSSS